MDAAQEPEQEENGEECGAVTHRKAPPRETAPALATVTSVIISNRRAGSLLYFTIQSSLLNARLCSSPGRTKLLDAVACVASAVRKIALYQSAPHRKGEPL